VVNINAIKIIFMHIKVLGVIDIAILIFNLNILIINHMKHLLIIQIMKIVLVSVHGHLMKQKITATNVF